MSPRLLALLLAFLPACLPAGEGEYPQTCAAAVAVLQKEVPAETQDRIRAMEKGELITLHQGFGTGVRNDLGLLKGNDALAKDCSGGEIKHPDDTSMIIIERFWQALQDG